MSILLLVTSAAAYLPSLRELTRSNVTADFATSIDTTGGEAVATSSDASAPAQWAFDGRDDRFWHTANGRGPSSGYDEFLEYRFPEAVVVGGYSITSRECSAAITCVTDPPHTWFFQGSNGGDDSWTTLHIVTGETWAAQETRYYTGLLAAAPFTTYRWFFPSADIGGVNAEGNARVWVVVAEAAFFPPSVAWYRAAGQTTLSTTAAQWPSPPATAPRPACESGGAPIDNSFACTVASEGLVLQRGAISSVQLGTAHVETGASAAAGLVGSLAVSGDVDVKGALRFGAAGEDLAVALQQRDAQIERLTAIVVAQGYALRALEQRVRAVAHNTRRLDAIEGQLTMSSANYNPPTNLWPASTGCDLPTDTHGHMPSRWRRYGGYGTSGLCDEQYAMTGSASINFCCETGWSLIENSKPIAFTAGQTYTIGAWILRNRVSLQVRFEVIFRSGETPYHADCAFTTCTQNLLDVTSGSNTATLGCPQAFEWCRVSFTFTAASDRPLGYVNIGPNLDYASYAAWVDGVFVY